MPASMHDWPIYGDFFSSAEMRAVWDQDAAIRRWLEVEAAISTAQAKLGIIPPEAGPAVAKAASDAEIDLGRLAADTKLAGRPIVGLSKQLKEQIADGLGDFAHWGCTTQDIMDTATVLQMREALTLIDADIEIIDNLLADLIARHGDVRMIGRTNGQYAQEITVGLKFSVWREELMRRRQALRGAAGRALYIQFGGAVGTLASFGDLGQALRREVAKKLDLKAGDIHWQNARDGVVEVLSLLGVLCGSLEKIGREFNALSGDDIGEMRERAPEGSGASSAMPHKQNQRCSEFAEAVARLGRHRASQATDLMGHQHERSGGVWIAEWATIPEVLLFTSGALGWMKQLLAVLEIDENAMARNLAASGGAGESERYTLLLARHIGRAEARKVVESAIARSRANERTLTEELREDPRAASLSRGTERRLS